MTAPRQVLPGNTYLVTRRCAQRQLLLRPSAVTNAIVLYVLAVAAQRFGVDVHAFCVLSNHWHLIVTDPHARLPAFEQYLDSLVARAVNASLGRWESFWAPASYSAVALATSEDILEKTVYVLANPVSAGLVRTAREWPGLWSAPEQIGGGAITVRRPDTFFRAGGYMPETVELRLVTPAGFESSEHFCESLVAALAAREARAQHQAAAEGRAFRGIAKVLAQRWWGRPRPMEPRRALNPRVASRDKWKRIEALLQLREFRDAYRRALRSLRNGVTGVLFPAGTYWLRVFHGVRCAAPV